MFGENFKVRILLSLKNLDSFVGREMCCKVMNICKEYKLGICDMVVRFSVLKKEDRDKY